MATCNKLPEAKHITAVVPSCSPPPVDSARHQMLPAPPAPRWSCSSKGKGRRKQRVLPKKTTKNGGFTLKQKQKLKCQPRKSHQQVVIYNDLTKEND